MSYVFAGYLAVFGVLGLYATRTVRRARRAAARVLALPDADSVGEGADA
jgi:cbb3-type cytochrome oxidase subunit 3